MPRHNLGKLILHMTIIFVHDYFRPVLFFEQLLIFDHYYLLFPLLFLTIVLNSFR